MYRFFRILGLACILIAPAAQTAEAAQGGKRVTNSPHNLATAVPAGTPRAFTSNLTSQVCAFCHTPHNAVPDTPNWNHAPSAAVIYTPYSSTTAAASPDQPTGMSRLCLSCHDGTVALGAVRVSPPGANKSQSANRLTGRANLTTDLSNDHPISFAYDAALVGLNPELADPARIGLPLEDVAGESHLQCTTCHDPHDNAIKPFLRQTTLDGALCTTCHTRGGATGDWSASSHATSLKTPTRGNPWAERKPAWQGTNVAQNACFNCHQLHNAATPPRLIKDIEENTCYLCHDGSVAATDIEAESRKPYQHTLEMTPNSDHDATSAENPLSMPLHVECMDCHNPHAVADAPPMISFNPSDPAAPHTDAPAANAMIAGVTGIGLNGNVVPEITNQYELCFKCHGVPGQSACGADRCQTATTWSMVRQDGVYNIRDKVNSGSPGLVSYHPFETNNPANNTEVQSLKDPLNATTSLIYCTDCHSNDQSGAFGGVGPDGPHGSTYEFMLGQRYDMAGETPYSSTNFDLCFKCHDETRFSNPVTSGFNHDIHLRAGNATCANCHDPHGSRKFPHLINFLLNTTNGGTWTITSDCGGGPGSCGRPEPTWEDQGPQKGQCFLNCHGKSHDDSGNFTY